MTSAGDLLWSWTFEAVGGRAARRWRSHVAERVTDALIFLAPSEPKMTTRSAVVRRAAIERDGKAWSSGLGCCVYTAAGRAVEEERLSFAQLHEDDLRSQVEDLLRGGRRSPPPSSYIIEPEAADGFSWPSSPEEIRRQFRERVKAAHPDTGGSHDAFIALERSYRRALAMAGGA